MEVSIDKIAQNLTLSFLDENEIPAKYKPRKVNKKILRNQRQDSIIQLNFDKQVNNWKLLVQTLFDRMSDKELALRLVSLKPIVNGQEKIVTENKDFLETFNYLYLRRDVENCSDNELGKLSMLQTKFQNIIEERINKE